VPKELRGDGFIRRSTAETVWELAEEVKRSWETAGTIGKARNLSQATLYKLSIIFERQFLSWCGPRDTDFRSS
jgi:hypothetical protein